MVIFKDEQKRLASLNNVCLTLLLQPNNFVSDEARMAIPCAEMQALTLQCLNSSGCRDLPFSSSLGCYIESTTSPSLENDPGLPLLSRTWVIQLAMVSVLSSPLLFKLLSATWRYTALPTPLNGKDPLQVPYLMPVVGNLISYLLDAAKLASSITCVVPFLTQSLPTCFLRWRLTGYQAQVWGFYRRSAQFPHKRYLRR